ncbi:roadblock/LC7 domain-containing protein [Streptomyces sp. NBC_01142]|uniref:roadblock/LC7 domain-containing protein n=1 Tax=Streptomyces sp. NBC_01142 TaxID=2975865 RepID=UPI0022596B11|nr:roadblock/LC7 domain-containing protein [Streptomyces sp. NBC_01142]MCX4827092.1 roadblock/LC7 domain-containing protein [Streptomyces sp. NBC_01142]
MQSDGFPTSATSARDQLSGLLAGLLDKAPGTTRALLASGDGLKLAWTEQPIDDADNLAAVISGLYSLGRQQFKDMPGGIRQVVVEHDGGSLFVMSAGAEFTDNKAVNTVLAVVATPDADAGQVGYEMETFIGGLDEHLVVAARPNSFSGQGL